MKNFHARPDGETGRRTGLKIPGPEMDVPVQFRFRAPLNPLPMNQLSSAAALIHDGMLQRFWCHYVRFGLVASLLSLSLRSLPTVRYRSKHFASCVLVVWQGREGDFPLMPIVGLTTVSQ
jgi:hypothetical protein